MSRSIQEQTLNADIFITAILEEPTRVLKRERVRMARQLRNPKLGSRYGARRYVAGIDRELAYKAGRLSRGQRRRYELHPVWKTPHLGVLFQAGGGHGVQTAVQPRV